MKTKKRTIKLTAKHLTWTTIGILYFPIFLVFWLLKILSRLVLALSYCATLDGLQGKRVLKSIFSKDYERTF